MNVQDIYGATQDIKKALVAMGYTSADCRITFNLAGPILVYAEASAKNHKMVFVKTPTDQALQEALAEVEVWLRELPNALEQAKTDFMKMLEQLPAKAAEFGVELPVKLAS